MTETLERGKSPHGPPLKSFSPKGQSLKNIFKTDSAGNQSFDDVSDMSFGVSPIIRDSFRESFDGGDQPQLGEASPQRSSGKFSSPSRQISNDRLAPAQSRQTSFEPDRESGAGKGTPSSAPEDMSGQYKRPERIDSHGRVGDEENAADDEAASYNDMKVMGEWSMRYTNFSHVFDICSDHGRTVRQRRLR